MAIGEVQGEDLAIAVSRPNDVTALRLPDYSTIFATKIGATTTRRRSTHGMEATETAELIAPGVLLFTCCEDITIEFERGNVSFHLVNTGSRFLAYWLIGRHVLGWVPIGQA